MTDFSEWVAKKKDVWTRVYDEVIAPDFEQEWKRRDEEHQDLLKRRDEHQQILARHINDEFIKNAYLTEENSRLKRRLAKSSIGGTAAGEHVEEGATVSADEYHHLIDKYNELHKLNEETTQRLKYLEKKNVAVMQKNKEMKESVIAWQRFSDRYNAPKIKTSGTPAIDIPKLVALDDRDELRPSMPSSPRSSLVRTPASLAGLDRSSPVPMAPLTHAEFPSARASGHPYDSGMMGTRMEVQEEVADPHQAEKVTTNPPANDILNYVIPNYAEDPPDFPQEQPRGEKLGSSQTTEDEIIQQNSSLTRGKFAMTEENDVPEFVSERSLKRKRGNPVAFQVYADRTSSDGTPKRPFRVKDEQFSSPPSMNDTYHLMRKETMDLDELGPTVISTPHRRLRRAHPSRENLPGTLRHQRSCSVPLFLKEEVQVEDHDDEGHLQHLPRSEHEHEVVTSETRAYSEPMDSAGSDSHALQPLDPNVVSAHEGTSNKRLKKGITREAGKHQLLAESGEEPPPTDEKYRRLYPKLARAQFNRKIRISKGTDNVIETPTKSKTPTTAASSKTNAGQMPTPPSSTARPSFTPSRPSPTTGQPPRSRARKGPATGPVPESRIWRLGKPESPASRASLLKQAPSPPKRQRPLRTTPIDQLSITDFKPNPAYNQGYTYAFAETVRKRGDRACLPGCTDPKCCGSTFRTLAAAAAPLSASQEEAVLQNYLGDAYDGFGLTQMAAAERAELVLQARTREMAAKHGKHRQAYERHTTPPGFWRVDFPTTQEQLEDRRKAEEMERSAVQERWMEAMRKGGKWIFRDE
ncbi:DNA repair protein endonuclease SAE2/CtIP C-terminus-domain-containing protein [Massariosphaeria phaeospora]|uniref:DNA repair protein endonuclease SAE2/CtIP C-terminus-domain-containing protein n=1 Tax=Massariosphaeria phaeospora TaxID=100035 RepID=A0A7C8IFM1_9PLEO|nr:DNA repair protein endonuclease SAE2/CtIP C-terminus-domain-containing protein [Massariosphaeria phaeospora]